MMKYEICYIDDFKEKHFAVGDEIFKNMIYERYRVICCEQVA